MYCHSALSAWYICLLAICTERVCGYVPRFTSKLKVDSSIHSTNAINDEKTVSFLAWAESEGIGASDDIPDNFYSVSVPAELVLETNNNRPPSPFLNFCSEDFWSQQCKWDHRLALKLLYEVKGFALKSSRKPWLDKLPVSFSTPLHWTKNEILKAQYGALEAKVDRQRIDWRAFYEKWLSHIEKSSEISQVTFDDFVWAMECVNSRAFSGIYEGSSAQERRGLYLFTGALTLIWPLAGLGTAEQSLGAAVLVAISIISKDFFFSRAAGLKRYVICPYIDMFNHKSTCISDVSYGYFSDTFELTTQGYKAGEQMYISYGKQSNDRLLQYYGFTDMDNPHDLYDFGMPFLELILKRADAINEAVSFPTEPSPPERLQQIAEAMQNTVLESSKDSALQKNALTLSSGDDKTTRYFKTVSASTGTSRKLMTFNYQTSIDPPIQHELITNYAFTTLILEGLASHFDDISIRSMRALYCSTTEWNELVKQSGGVNSLKSLNKAGAQLSAETEIKVNKALQSLIRIELVEKATTLEEDNDELAELVSSRTAASTGKKGKNDAMKEKGEKDTSKKGFGSKLDSEIEILKTDSRSKTVRKEPSFEVDPSGLYSDGDFAALTFRIQKKKILIDALQEAMS